MQVVPNLCFMGTSDLIRVGVKSKCVADIERNRSIFTRVNIRISC